MIEIKVNENSVEVCGYAAYIKVTEEVSKILMKLDKEWYYLDIETPRSTIRLTTQSEGSVLAKLNGLLISGRTGTVGLIDSEVRFWSKELS